MDWFGKKKDESWRRLAEELGADYEGRGFWRGSRVRAQLGPWTLMLDTYTVHAGQAHITYTRIRAPYLNPDGFRFTVFRARFLSNLGRRIGLQDLNVGDPEFDAAFVVKGNDPDRVRALFANPALRDLIRAQPRIRLTVKDDEGWFGTRFPDGVDELYFQAEGVIADVDQLRNLFDLFAAVLDRLCQIGSAVQADPGLVL